LLVVVWLTACATPTWRTTPRVAEKLRTVTIYVVRRGWHIDIGVAISELRPPLDAVGAAFPGARYLLFGFGDRGYVLRGQRVGNMLAALIPAPGVVLATGLSTTPQVAFSADQVIEFRVDDSRARSLQAFVWQALNAGHAGLTPLGLGPYGGSVFYASDEKYSAIRTCNTWAAQVLQSAGLPVHSVGVLFARQLWSQTRSLARASSGP
jgi:Protein of unknown function (DUF2459)